MSTHPRLAGLSRRAFLQGASGALAAHTLAPSLSALAPSPGTQLRSAWVADAGGIHSLRQTRGTWLRTHYAACDVPRALTLRAETQTLYVAHGTSTYAGRPAASLSCYRIGPGEELHLLHREGLSLACILPEALAVSPDGTLLVVASRTAGILNVLPLDATGVPGPVTAARKVIAWQAAEALAAGQPLEMRFVGGRTLVVSHGTNNRQSVYRCSPDEIASIPPGDAALQMGSAINVSEPPSSLQDHLALAAYGQAMTAAVWL